MLFPGGPFDGEKKLPPEIEANKEQYYHLNDPLYVQYFSYLSEVILPRVTTQQPTLMSNDDYLLTVKAGNYWFKWYELWTYLCLTQPHGKRYIS